MQQVIWGFLATFLVSLLSLLGIIVILISPVKIKKLTFWLVSLAVGALFGDVFFHLLPQLAENGLGMEQGVMILGGLLAFLVIEKFVAWRHCHIPTSKRHPHPLAVMNLIGDGLHNFLDGLIIGGTFMVSIPLGLATALAVSIHEIPQEIGDFGILIHAGFSKTKALVFNFLSALTAVLGFVVAIFLGSMSGALVSGLVALTIGGFLYIAGSDLVPELKMETHLKGSLGQLAIILLGIILMYGMTFLE